MSPSRRDWLTLLAALAVSLALFLVTYPSRAQPLQTPRGGAGAIPVQATFADFGQRTSSFSCEIDAAGHRREKGSVGFTARDRAIWLSRKIFEKAGQELADVNEDLAIYGCTASVYESRVMPPDKDWEIETSLSCASDNDGFAAEARRIVAEWKESLGHGKDRMLADFYRARKIRVTPVVKKGEDQFLVDYAAVIKRARPRLAGCARALVQAGGNTLDADLFTAYLQHLKYVELKPTPGEYHVRDFLVPTQVLVEGRGDCDSKSAAFCALWTAYSADVILFMSDDHMLIGYRAAPTTHLQTFSVKGIPYVPCDVSGLYKFPCGNVPQKPREYRPVFVSS